MIALLAFCDENTRRKPCQSARGDQGWRFLRALGVRNTPISKNRPMTRVAPRGENVALGKEKRSRCFSIQVVRVRRRMAAATPVKRGIRWAALAVFL